MQKILFNFILYFFLILLSYIFLILIDILLPRIPKFLSEDYKYASSIINERIKNESELEKNIKFKKYDAMIFPSNFNYFPLNKIVKKML